MSDHWFQTTIGEQVTLQRGFDITKLTQKPGNVPVVSTAGVLSYHDTHMAKAPGVIVGRKGNGIGRAHYIELDYWPHDTTLWVKDFKGNHPKYVFYFFRQMFALLNSMDVGSANPTLNRNHVHPIPISWPPLPEQKAIATILGAIDDKIDLNRRMNATLEGIARALFRSWFVDLDPVRAKSEGRQPPGLDPQTADLFPNSFEDSTVGTIPKGWRALPLPEAFEVNPTRRIPTGQPSPYLDMGNMPVQGHRAETWVDRTVGSGARFTNGDTLVARITPCLENGKTAFVDFLAQGETGWGSTEYIVLRPKPPLPVEYAYYLARTEEFRAFAIQNMTGTSGRQRVPVSCFGQYRVIVPSPGIAEAFGNHAHVLMALVRHNCEQSATLAALRDALLPKLLSGEIRVSSIEAETGRVKCL